MSDSPQLSFRSEVLDFLRSSERLISAAITPDNLPMTNEEREIIEYYVTEVGRILTPLGTQK